MAWNGINYVCLLLCGILSPINAYSRIDPSDTVMRNEICTSANLMPEHLDVNGNVIAAQSRETDPVTGEVTGVSPYVILLDTPGGEKTYHVNSNIKVRLIANSKFQPSSPGVVPAFRGIVLQMQGAAATPTSASQPVGRFRLDPNLQENLQSTLGYNFQQSFQYLTCQRPNAMGMMVDMPDNTLVHSNSFDKVLNNGQGPAFTWRPNPVDGLWNIANGYGDIHAKATIVMDTETFWVSIQTGALSYLNPCEPPPCLNGGTCTPEQPGQTVEHTCTCVTGFAGPNCGTQIVSPCLNNPCSNGGICIPVGTTGFFCNCANTGYSGSTCNVDQCYEPCNPPIPNVSQCLRCPINTCEKDILGNFIRCTPAVSCNPVCVNGNCVNQRCICNSGWIGDACDTAASCQNIVCQNGGFCAPLNGNPFVVQCNCDGTGYTGAFCENPFCFPPCLNNGQCVVSIGNTLGTCDCTGTGFTGSSCEISPCVPSPCLNGGTCFALPSSPTGVWCNCLPFFDGDFCANPVCTPSCVQGICLANTATSTSFCQCFGGFTGPTCSNRDCTPACVNGLCVTDPATFVSSCQCFPGYTGSTCVSPVCTPACQNNGQCTVVAGSSFGTCDCTGTGFTGSACETPFCSPPCFNGGQCLSNGFASSCQCPPGYQGNQCEIPVCTPACQNNGRCTVVAGNSFGTCDCTGTGFTGSACETPFCSPPCFNGGQCLSNGFASSCQCPPGYRGNQCEIRDDCLITTGQFSCQNGGTCTTNANGEFATCVNCNLGWSGPFCEVYNPCTPGIHQCLTGECQVDSASTFPDGYRCVCRDSWFGVFCDTPPNGCNNQPCQNGGGCTTNGPNGYTCNCINGWFGMTCIYRDDCIYGGISCPNGASCLSDPTTGVFLTCEPCPVGYSGRFCENDVCNPSQCVNGNCNRLPGTFSCLCDPGWTGTLCNQPTSCNSGPCNNGGTCIQSGADGGYVCRCTSAYFGPTCADPVVCNSLAPNPCQNGGICIPSASGTDYQCQCPPPWTGNYCEIAVACQNPSLCYNGGTCEHDNAGIFIRCRCLPGYSGDYCNLDGCNNSPCGDHGFCQATNNQFGYTCTCFDAYTGNNCEIAPVCGYGPTNDPCYPNGLCELGSTSTVAAGYTCKCYAGFFGLRCENVDPCYNNPCFNGGLCTSDGNGRPTCECYNQYTGQYCETRPVCQERPCYNGGVCYADPNSRSGLQYRCECTGSYTGTRCEILSGCYNNPCLSGGRCISDELGGYSCDCVQGYTGRHCSIEPVCVNNPCYNGQCVPSPGGTPTCICYDGYFGPYCDIRNECYNFINCLNGGTCDYDSQTGVASCSCTPEFRGDQCHIPNFRLCDVNICLNGGTCWDEPGEGSVCTCIKGYGGDICEHRIITCAERTCRYGECEEADFSRGKTSRCKCQTGWTGEQCDERYQNPCQPNPCDNGRACVLFTNYGGTYQCICRSGYTGVNCQTRPPTGGSTGSKTVIFSLWTILTALGISFMLRRL